MKQDQKKLTPRSQDQSAWYTELIQRAELADYSPVKGCMVIRPYGYAIWEGIQRDLDARIKAAGVKNAYFPLFIPYSFLEREAEHVDGFAPEVAIVTHAGGKELEEKLVVRPTSETIMYEMFKDWITSYRDLPLLINQWANIVRWEKRTTPFLRTTEFLWQEGHTAHATKGEAEEEVMRALDMYHDFVRDILAMHVVKGYKTEKEKFAGADYTTTIEGLMHDKKALQSGTSHLLGQNFAKSFNVKYTDKQGKEEFVWQTSWGLSTRVIGGIILMHGDDNGLVLPPKIAPVEVIVIPVLVGNDQKNVLEAAQNIFEELKGSGFRVEMDDTDNTPGWKFSQAEMRGIPVRIELGPRDLAEGKVTLVTRLNGDKKQVPLNGLSDLLPGILEDIQVNMLENAKKFTEDNTVRVATYDEFIEATKQDAGFIEGYFSGDKVEEKKIQEETKYTTRCIPFDTFDQSGKCFVTGENGKLTLFAKAY